MKSKNGILLSAAFAGIMMAGQLALADHHEAGKGKQGPKGDEKVDCYGISSCAGDAHACHNQCATKVTAEECKKQGGTLSKPKSKS